MRLGVEFSHFQEGKKAKMERQAFCSLPLEKPTLFFSQNLFHLSAFRQLIHQLVQVSYLFC